MKTTSISVQNSGVTLAMTEEPDDTQREDRGMHCVKVTLPDGRVVRFVDQSGAKFQDIVELSERDGGWAARFGYIPVDGGDKSGGDHYEEKLDFPNRDAALGYGLERARELGVPLLELTWPGDGFPTQYTCLFQPVQVVVTDRLGEVVFTARNGTLEPECDGFSDECQAVQEIVVSESMSPVVICGLVSEAWHAPCAVTVRPMPVLNSEVKGVCHE